MESRRPHIADESCKQCHPAVDFENSRNEPIIAHSLHEKESIHCTACHFNLVHSTFRAVDVKPPIEICKDCHRRMAVAIKEKKLYPVTQLFMESAN